jgi:hypothetical protein
VWNVDVNESVVFSNIHLASHVIHTQLHTVERPEKERTLNALECQSNSFLPICNREIHHTSCPEDLGYPRNVRGGSVAMLAGAIPIGLGLRL